MGLLEAAYALTRHVARRHVGAMHAVGSGTGVGGGRPQRGVRGSSWPRGRICGDDERHGWRHGWTAFFGRLVLATTTTTTGWHQYNNGINHATTIGSSSLDRATMIGSSSLDYAITIVSSSLDHTTIILLDARFAATCALLDSLQ